MGTHSPSQVMAVLERSSSSAAAAVAALIALASVAAVAGEVFFQEKFDGKPDLARVVVFPRFSGPMRFNCSLVSGAMRPFQFWRSRCSSLFSRRVGDSAFLESSARPLF